MPGYFIANYSITDAEKYGQYGAAVLPTLAGYTCIPLVVSHENENLEGEPGSNMVVLEFDSVDQAKSWYNSDAYQAIIHLRLESTDGWAIIADKFAVPQS